MRLAVLFAFLFAGSLHADCTTPIFPSSTKTLRYLQTVKTGLFDGEADMTFSDRKVRGEVIRWKQTFARHGGSTSESVSEFRCSPAGITPIGEGATFTGVQYGNDLKPGTTWKWTWAATGISAAYDYTVVGKESVTVPAGTYSATRVDYKAMVKSETRGDLGPVRGSLWIAEGVGLVKQVEDDPGAIALMETRTTLELLSRQ